METVSQHAAVGPGYEALRAGLAWLDLSARGKIVAKGEDRARLLHAMTTHHIQQLQPGEGCYAFFLNPQGRILADANVFSRPEDFLLDVEPETRESLYQHIDKYIIADDVTLEDATSHITTIALEGPDGPAAAARMGAPVPDKPWSYASWNAAMVARVSFSGAPGVRFFVPTEHKDELLKIIQQTGAVPASLEDARIVRLEHFKPRYGEDIFASTLTQETQQTHALHFSKGCYIGQEIVERVRSRGLVHRLLVGVEIEGAEAPAPDTRLFHGEENAGKMASAAFSPALGKVVGMGYVRRELAEPGTVLALDGRRVEVRAPHQP